MVMPFLLSAILALTVVKTAMRGFGGVGFSSTFGFTACTLFNEVVHF